MAARGELTLTVLEANGQRQDGQQLWDPNFVNGFVKVEIRGGARTVKAQTTQKRVNNFTLLWEEDLKLNVLDEARELRLMLCRERRSTNSGRTSAAVTAACGIYVSEILDNVPIDKYFELFKPSSGSEGGTIHIKVEFADARGNSPQENGHLALGGLRAQPSDYDSDNVGSPVTPARHGRTRFADEENSGALTDIQPVPEEGEEDGPQGGKRGSLGIKLLTTAALIAAAAGAAVKVVNSRR